jgi:hypothetical protein
VSQREVVVEVLVKRIMEEKILMIHPRMMGNPLKGHLQIVSCILLQKVQNLIV